MVLLLGKEKVSTVHLKKHPKSKVKRYRESMIQVTRLYAESSLGPLLSH